MIEYLYSTPLAGIEILGYVIMAATAATVICDEIKSKKKEKHVRISA